MSLNCPACEGAVPVGARFCAYCGISLRVCPTCSIVMPGEAEFCGECGTVLRNDPGAFGVDGLTDEIDVSSLNYEMGRDDILGFMYEIAYPERRDYIREGELTIGAGDKNDIVIDKPAVSWNHALIIARTDRVRIQDTASTNGTFVNDVPLKRPRDLRHGDILRFGNVNRKVWLKPLIRN